MKLFCTSFVLLQALFCSLFRNVGAGVGPKPPVGSRGCGIEAAAINTLIPDHLESDGLRRDFDIYIPIHYNKNKATPLILSFHGHDRDLFNQAEISRFNDSAINPNMIAVFPNGRKNKDGKRGWEGAPYAAKGVDDLQFVTDLLHHMRMHYCIDNSRIYATGKSNGGGFVDLLACSAEHGRDFAAFAMNSAALYNESGLGSFDCEPEVPTPILEFHGTDDHTIPYAGDADRRLPNVGTWLATWAVRNGCPNPPIPVTNTEIFGVHYTEYSCKGVDAVVQGYKVDGQAHWWISTVPNDDNVVHGKPHLAPIDASRVMMDFFNANVKRDV